MSHSFLTDDEYCIERLADYLIDALDDIAALRYAICNPNSGNAIPIILVNNDVIREMANTALLTHKFRQPRVITQTK